jgi:hypothetical protein
MEDGLRASNAHLKLRAILVAAISFFGLCADGEPITPRETIQLFNGVNFNGLYTWLKGTKRGDPTRVFRITNGMIWTTPSLGYLATEREYQNYDLRVEFKWGERTSSWREGKARDSGIFLHATGPDGNSHDGDGAFMAGIECNLFQGATGDILLIRGNDAKGKLIAPRITAFVSEDKDAEGWPWCRSSGRSETIERWGRLNWLNKSPAWKDELDFRGPHDVERPYGEWNEVKCICDGKTIRIELNGQLVNMAWYAWPETGKILLQCEGSEIFFRKFELRPLPPGSKKK